MTRFALTIEYDGRPFMGWQRQSHGPSVQQALEEAVTRITGEEAAVHGAGRTDAGVHAIAMRAHVDIEKAIQPFRLMEALNAQLRPAPVAVLAARALTPEPAEQVSLTHLHQANVSVREQADIVVARLRELGAASFRELVADAAERLVVVARFLALLELFRERAVTFEQLTPLGELRVRWVAGDADAIEISAEFDTETDPQERSDDRTR